MDNQKPLTPEQQYLEDLTKAAEATRLPDEIARTLTDAEERKMQDGFAVEEMTKGAGWAIVKDILDSVQTHTWVSPVGLNKEEWEFAELNAFHRANNAKELIDSLNQLILDSHELQRLKLGETKGTERMRI